MQVCFSMKYHTLAISRDCVANYYSDRSCEYKSNKNGVRKKVKWCTNDYSYYYYYYYCYYCYYYYVTKDNSMLFKLYCNLCSYNSFFLSVTYFAFDFEFKALARYPFTCPFIFDGCILKQRSLFTAWKCVKAPFLNKKTWRSITALSKIKHTLILKPKLYFTDSVVEWSRVLDLKSGGPWFKSSTLLLSGFVHGSPEFNSSTALCK